MCLLIYVFRQGADRFLVVQFLGGSPRFVHAELVDDQLCEGQHCATEHPAGTIQQNLDSFRSSDSATRAIIVGIHPVTDSGQPGWGHWVCLLANKYGDQREYLLLDSDNHAVVNLHDNAGLQKYDQDDGLRARLQDEIKGVNTLISCCEGSIDLRSCVADSLLREKLNGFRDHEARLLAQAQIDELKCQLRQVRPVDNSSSLHRFV